jgi:hypothetical protein
MKLFVDKQAPANKAQLITALIAFWDTLDTEKCNRYIDHLYRVLPSVVMRLGGPSGF